MRKSATQPRRLYLDNATDTVYVRFNSRLYAAPEGSDIDLDEEVVCTPLQTNGGRARIEVKATKSGTTETWKSITL